MSNETSISPIPSPDAVTIIVAILQIVICVGGLLLYLLSCYIMLKYKKTTFSNPFYTLALALAAPDCLHMALELICAVPVVFRGFENMPYLFVAVCGYMTTLAYWWLAPLMVVIGVNRYVAVCYFQVYKTMFSPLRIKILIVACFGCAFILPTLMFSCNCIYLFKGEAWKFYCDGSCGDLAIMTNVVLSSAYTIAVALIYLIIFVQYRLIKSRMGAAMQNRLFSDSPTASTNKNQEKQMKKESALMIQFALISLVLILYIATFWFVALVWTSRYGEMFLNTFISLNSCISPILYLSFGSDFRTRLPWKVTVAPSTHGQTNG